MQAECTDYYIFVLMLIHAVQAQLSAGGEKEKKEETEGKGGSAGEREELGRGSHANTCGTCSAALHLLKRKSL